MKKAYNCPSVVSAEVSKGAFPLVVALGGLAGYAATRSVVNTMRVNTISAKSVLNRGGNRSDI